MLRRVVLPLNPIRGGLLAAAIVSVAGCGPGGDIFAGKREEMVQLLAKGDENREPIKDERVLEAMRRMPRQRFVPLDMRLYAYNDEPLPIGDGQTISQPYIVALMTELAKVGPEDKVLEIGTGSGYQAAILSELAAQVYTIEIIDPLARRAVDAIDELGIKNIQVRIGDGYQGWPDASPFDAILVTAAAPEVPPLLIAQLAPNGTLVIPEGGPEAELQYLVVYTKLPTGMLARERSIPVRFVPMTGKIRERR